MVNSLPLSALLGDLQGHQLSKTGQVGIHVFFSVRWNASVVVQVNALKAVSASGVQLGSEFCRQAFDLYADWALFVVHPLTGHEPDWLVVAIGHDVTAIFLLDKAVGKMGMPQLFLQHFMFSYGVLDEQAVDNRRAAGFGQDQECVIVSSRVWMRPVGGRVEREIAAEGRRLGADEPGAIQGSDWMPSDVRCRRLGAAQCGAVSSQVAGSGADD